MKQMHPIQLQILKKLLFSISLTYLKLKPNNIENNQFDFHLNQLKKLGYVEKIENVYFLTNEGKEYANMMDTDSTTIIKQAKISMAICCTRIRDEKLQFLIYTRLKQPFYKCQGFMSGKVNYGESLEDALKRELKEETNLEGAPLISSIRHYRVYGKVDNRLMEDKFMFFCLVKEPKGDLIGSSEGMYEWVDEDKVFSYVTNHFVSNEQFREDIKEFKNFDGNLKYIEITQYTDKF